MPEQNRTAVSPERLEGEVIRLRGQVAEMLERNWTRDPPRIAKPQATPLVGPAL